MRDKAPSRLSSPTSATLWVGTRPRRFSPPTFKQFASLKPADAIAWVQQHYLTTGSTNLDPGCKGRWVNFLNQPESIAAQVTMATNGVLAHAKREVAAYCPDYTDSSRPYVFFFDLVTQEGGMTVGHQTVPHYSFGSDARRLRTPSRYASAHDATCAIDLD
jgi:hypothetical protein